jgi:hypothetical protein
MRYDKISELGYKSSGIRSPMIIGWLFLEHSHQTLVKVTWKWVIYYTADALKSLYRKEVYFILSSSKELTSWVKLQVEIVCVPYKRFVLAA